VADPQSTLLGQLDEAASGAANGAHLGLYCGPDVYHALNDGFPAPEDAEGWRADVNIVFTMDPKAWELHQDGEPLNSGTMEEL
jgi:hypothetical protein